MIYFFLGMTVMFWYVILKLCNPDENHIWKSDCRNLIIITLIINYQYFLIFLVTFLQSESALTKGCWIMILNLSHVANCL